MSIREHTPAHARHASKRRIRQSASAYVSTRQHTLAYVNIRQPTSAYVPGLDECEQALGNSRDLAHFSQRARVMRVSLLLLLLLLLGPPLRLRHLLCRAFQLII